MTPAARELFDYASRHVTADDIARFCPSDPGYPDYVRTFTEILSSGVPPKAADFDLTETISLTIYGEIDGEKLDPVRFRRFRTLTNAVGIALFIDDTEVTEMDLAPNYLAIRLLEDAHGLQDETLLRLLPGAFADLQRSVAESAWTPEEVPFLLLGRLLLAFQGYSPSANIPQLIEELKAEAASHEAHASPTFFWGCTRFDQLHVRWKHFVRLYFPPDSTDETINSLRAALLCSPTSR